MMQPLQIDGSQGEGGGQIIRTALALSVITGKPFQVYNVRAKRPKPGLQNQHLTCVQAAAAISEAELHGAKVGSIAFTFQPRSIIPGQYSFKIGTAGSTMLVLQTVLPPLMLACQASELLLEGGTHNTHAPPFEFIKNTFLPLLEKMGVHCLIHLERFGFYPPGGGKVSVKIDPARHLSALELQMRGQTDVSATALVVKLPKSVGERELAVASQSIPEIDAKVKVNLSENALSPGNALMIEARSNQLTETFTQIGERGLRAEIVAQRACTEAQRYLKTDVPVGEHLADQLLLPLALAGKGSFYTVEPSLHTKTNIAVIQQFLDLHIDVQESGCDVWRIAVGS